MSTEKFVKVWMGTSNNSEAAKKLGTTPQYVASVACALRKKGVKLPLRRLGRPPGSTVDVEALNSLIAAH